MSHYFSSEPEAGSAPRTVELPLSDGTIVELTADAGVFSARRLDPGTSVLLQQAPVPNPGSTVLDLGCGYGPIAIWAAHGSKRGRVIGLDVNTRAIDLCNQNARKLGLSHVKACVASEIEPDMQFDRIYSNPPARIGKAALHDLLLTWLPRLRDDGDAYLVVQKHLGSDSLLKWLNDQGFPTKKVASKKAFRILHVTR